MATYKPQSKYSFELADTEYKKMTKKLDGYVSERQKHKLHQTGKEMRMAAQKYKIEIR